MCELFGISSKTPVRANDLLRDFYMHSERNPDGWGLAVFRGHAVSLEKEPVKANKSSYLSQRLSWDVTASNLMAHIRLATIGYMDYSNCHPFVWDDSNGRSWTLIHNGTIFETDLISPYYEKREGTTDSESMLLYLVDLIDREMDKKGRGLSAKERFAIIDEALVKLAARGKLNILLFDGEQMYVHANYRDKLFRWQEEATCCFSTQPLRIGRWEKIPLNQTLGYISGELVHEGTKHKHEYFDKDHDLTPLHSAFAAL